MYNFSFRNPSRSWLRVMTALWRRPVIIAPMRGMERRKDGEELPSPPRPAVCNVATTCAPRVRPHIAAPSSHDPTPCTAWPT